MHTSRSSRSVRLRPLVVPVAAAVLLLGVTACGSDGDSGATDTTASVATDVVTSDAPTDTTALEPPASDVAAESSPECNGVSAADVGAAAGVDFDAADDVSVDADVSCLFSNATGTDSVVVLTQSTTTYLGGALDGLSSDDALGILETSYTTVMDDPTVERTTIGGSPAIVVTGVNSIVGSPLGYASTVVNGVVIEVSSDGSGISADAAGFGPVVTAVAELVVAAQG